MQVTILTDDKNSWFVPYAKKLDTTFSQRGICSELVFSQSEASGGDVSFLLSCTHIVKSDFLRKYKNNIVVHASDLPKGKGFTPLKWQILEGKNEIVLTLFEANESVDAGDYYMKEQICYKGTELLNELQNVMAEKIIKMCLDYVKNRDDLQPHKQEGSDSFYKRFSEDDDKLDVNKTLREQFQHLRIADNENHPLWFEYKGEKYILKIFRK